MSGQALDVENWDTHAEFYQRYMEPLTEQVFENLVGQINKCLHINNSSTLLDIGCGTGRMCEILNQEFPSINLLAVDSAKSMVDICKRREDWRNTRIEIMDGENLTIANGTKSHVLSTFVISLVNNPDRMVKEIKRVLSAGGVLGLATWADPYFEFLAKPWIDACRSHDPGYICPQILHQAWTVPREVTQSLENNGFTEIQSSTTPLHWEWDEIDQIVEYFFNAGNPRLLKYHASWIQADHTLEEIRPSFRDALYRRYGPGKVDGRVQALILTARG